MYFQLKTILALVIGLSLWLSPEMAFSTNYYLDSELGNDAYSGTRQNPGSGNQGPWKTVSATLGFPFIPGDSILFKKGGTWSGVKLKVSQSGDAGAVIYYGSYGKGEGKPILEEAEINIDASFIVVENFISRNSPKEGIERKTGTHIVIRNCEIYNATANGIRIIGYWNEGLEDVLVEGCYVENSGIDNITIHKGASYAEAGHGFVLRNNRCVGAGEEGYDLTTGSDILLENNTSENNSDGSIYCGMGVKGVTVRRHHSVNDRFAIMMKACRNIRIEYSIFVGDYRLLRMDQNPDLGAPANVELYNNIFWETGSYELARLKYTDGDITLKNNVFGGSSTNPLFYFENAETPAESGNFTFANNLYFPTNGDNNPRIADERKHHSV
ncbi:MAG: right-handed parallel beta-helix repeat-containing protein [Bacteroidia bacterium]